MQADPDGWARRQVGRTLGDRYRLERVLGVGGMGAVFSATHLAVGRTVAVKLLLPEVARDPTVAKRFHGEARTAAAIGRRGVVDVLDFDVDPDTGPYLVMEHLEGEPLSSRIARRGHLSCSEALWVGASVLRTLAAVHTRGIVHRDLKPDNVFLAKEEGREVVKILDFGISRIIDPERHSAQLTRPGAVLGTPVYMAPEQARGAADVDGRADIYAVGALLYEALGGEPPYRGNTWQQVFASVLTEPPRPLRELRPDLAESVCLLVDTAMAREPADRFPTAEAMLGQLEALEGAPAAEPAAPGPGSEPTSPAPARAGARSTGASGGARPLAMIALAAALLLGLATVGTAAWLWLRDAPGLRATSPVLVSPADAGTAANAPTGSPTAEPDARPEGPGAAAPTPTVPSPLTAPGGAAPGVPRARPGSGGGLPSGGPAAPPAVLDRLERELARAAAARRSGRREQATRLYEEVIRIAWDAQVPTGGAGAEPAAHARMALGEMAAEGIHPIPRTSTAEQFGTAFREVTSAYAEAAEHYGRVATFGHMDLTQCALVRSGEAAEELAGVVRQVRAPREIAKLDDGAADQFERGFRDSARAYLETAASIYEAAGRIPNGDPKCKARARASLARVLDQLGRRIP